MDTDTQNCSCGADDGCCGAAGFVRLRYYFGQHLGVVDFSDAQAYAVGKQRFHNRFGHGAGVLCGLTVERFLFPQGSPPTTPTTVLRVARGAALDACGREIVVGTDQCIDVATWFALQRSTSEELQAWQDGETRRLWIALRYRECGSDPAPAPREPCGCDAGGCQFSRVRESFELTLLTEKQAAVAPPQAAFPSAEELAEALQGIAAEEHPAVAGAERLGQALRQLLAAPCGDKWEAEWLYLAHCEVAVGTAGDTPVITDIRSVDNTIAERRYLLGASALQSLLLDVAGALVDGGLLGPGPTWGALSFHPGAGAADNDLLHLRVNLRQEGQPPAPVELAAQTLKAEHVKLSRFDPAGDWIAVVPSGVSVQPSADPNAGVQIEFAAGGLEAGQYRLTIAPPFETPIADQKLRPLRPLRIARHFRLIEDAGSLKMADTLS